MKAIINFILTTSIFFYSFSLNASWPVRYSGVFEGSINVALAIAIDASGNSYVIGYRENGNPFYGYYSITTIKYDNSGNQQWVAVYQNDLGGDAGNSIVVNANGSKVYVTGKKLVNGKFDFVTLCYYTSNGGLNWANTYNGPGNDDDIAYRIAIDANENVYVTGKSKGNGTDFDYATVKYNSSGEQQYVVRYDKNGYADAAFSLAIDIGGNVYVTGATNSSGSDNDFTTIKYNSSLQQQWVSSYDNGGDDYGTDIAVNSSFGVYVTGASYISGQLKCTTIKYNILGNQQWVVCDRTGAGQSISVFKRQIGEGPSSYTMDVFVTGYSGDYYGTYYGQTLRYSNNGSEDWREVFNSYGSACFYKIKNDISENVYVTGYTTISDESKIFRPAYLTVKYSARGAKQWDYIEDNQIEQIAFDLAVDENENAYVTGYSLTDLQYFSRDWLTTKYPVLGGDNFSANNSNQSIRNVTLSFLLYQNYPNPFNPATKIEYSIPQNGNVLLKVYDMLGREVAVLVNEYKNAGYYTVNFDGSKLSSGVYIYKLQSGQYSDMKKMVLIK